MRNNVDLIYRGLEDRHNRACQKQNWWKAHELSNWKFIFSLMYL